ncbi:dihydropteroate synthase [candidate division NPL-UPA2 bacterium]|nr:dihydropteroate synthase [candidate division NPL-UPA2 bacterium]
MVTEELKKKIFDLRCGQHVLKLTSRTHIMGILNVTPDSFFDGGRCQALKDVLARAHLMVEEGADIIDVGGESSRPGSGPIPLKVEIKRVIPVVEQLLKEVNIPISVDTYKAEIARQALALGAHMINDITALRGDPALGEVAAEYKAPLILMHMRGKPKDMQDNPHYQALIPELISFFKEAINRASSAGVEEEAILLDPGIGFGKEMAHNLEIISNLGEFRILGRPLVLGPSRKRVIGDVLKLPVGERLEGTAAVVAVAIWNGAHLIRVHDIREMARVARMVDAIRKGKQYISDTDEH